MPDCFIYLAESEDETNRFGHALASVLPDGTTIALQGTLGAGKTRLVQAVAEASGIDRRLVVSPTFVLIQQHEGGNRPIYHLDTYRLHDADEFLQLGPEEYFYETNGLTFVEWADRVEEHLPEERINIDIEVLGANQRRFTLTPLGSRYREIITQLEACLRTEG